MVGICSIMFHDRLGQIVVTLDFIAPELARDVQRKLFVWPTIRQKQMRFYWHCSDSQVRTGAAHPLQGCFHSRRSFAAECPSRFELSSSVQRLVRASLIVTRYWVFCE